MYRNQRFAVLGAGRSGLGAARLARLHGAEVTIFDEGDKAKPVEDFKCVLGQVARDLVVKAGDFDLVIISPGLDEHWPLPAKFTAAGVPLVGETEFGFNLTDMPMVAITGTNGKSTCTELIAALFNGCCMKSIPCGNHGMSLSEVVASGVKYDVLALEISSFQLETIRKFRAKASLWLNFAPDHLDRYPGMPEYFAAKARIFENCTESDVAIVRAGESVSSGNAQRWTFSAYGAEADYSYANGKFYHSGHEIGSAANLKVRGKHNMENVLAALMAGKVFGLEFDAMLKALADYEVPRHRCELIRTLADREYINDSKATNADAAEKALASFGNIYWIAGGIAKTGGIEPLQPYFNRIEKAYLIGVAAAEFAKTLEGKVPYEICETLPRAVTASARDAVAAKDTGAVVLLSPACASFDHYKNFEVRGDAFVDLVSRLQGVVMSQKGQG